MVSGWVPPFPDYEPCNGQSCYWPAFRQQTFFQVQIPSSSGSPQDHISPVTSRPGLEKASWPFSNHSPQPESHGGFWSSEQLLPEKKRKGQLKKKVSLVHLCLKSNELQRLWMKKKIHQLTCHFQYCPWMGTLITDRLRVLSVPAISGNVRSLVLKVKLHSGRFFPSLCFIPLHFLWLQCTFLYRFFFFPFTLANPYGWTVWAASWRRPQR